MCTVIEEYQGEEPRAKKRIWSWIGVPLPWIAVLAERGSLAASTGVDSVDDVIKYMPAGADVVMTPAALLRHGIGHTKELILGTRALASRPQPRLLGIRPRPASNQALQKTPTDTCFHRCRSA